MIDTTVRIATPEGVAFDLHPAGIPARLAAYAIDWAIQVSAGLVLILIAELLQFGGQWLSYLIIFVVSWFYMVISELSMGGRSVGKRALGLQVVMRDGSSIQFGASVVRNLLRFLDIFLALGLIVPVFNKGFRRLGDLMASTMVIYNPEKMLKRTSLDVFDGITPRPSERLADEETIQAIIDLARRRKGLGRGRRRELGEMALPLLMIDSERVSNLPYNQDNDPVEDHVIAVAGWHAGVRRDRNAN